MAATPSIAVQVSPGELIDKITILAIKAKRISNPDMLRNVEHERSILEAARDQAITATKDIAEATEALAQINEQLWEIEDEIRRCELAKDFGSKFIDLARAVYRTNDQRSEVKRRINDLLGSRLVEEKQYVQYGDP